MRHTRKVSDPIKPRTPPTFELFIPFQNHKIKKFSPALFFFFLRRTPPDKNYCFCSVDEKKKKSLNRLLQDTSYVEESQLFSHISKCKNFFPLFFLLIQKKITNKKEGGDVPFLCAQSYRNVESASNWMRRQCGKGKKVENLAATSALMNKKIPFGFFHDITDSWRHLYARLSQVVRLGCNWLILIRWFMSVRMP